MHDHHCFNPETDFGYRGRVLYWKALSIGLAVGGEAGVTNATLGAFGPPRQRGSARRVQSPKAMANEDHPPGSNKHETLSYRAGVFVCGGEF